MPDGRSRRSAHRFESGARTCRSTLCRRASAVRLIAPGRHDMRDDTERADVARPARCGQYRVTRSTPAVARLRATASSGDCPATGTSCRSANRISRAATPICRSPNVGRCVGVWTVSPQLRCDAGLEAPRRRWPPRRGSAHLRGDHPIDEVLDGHPVAATIGIANGRRSGLELYRPALWPGRRSAPPPGDLIEGSVDESERTGPGDCLRPAVNAELLVGPLGSFLRRRAGDPRSVGDDGERQRRGQVTEDPCLSQGDRCCPDSGGAFCDSFRGCFIGFRHRRLVRRVQPRQPRRRPPRR